MVVKLAGSMLVCCIASLQSSELPANAIIASKVMETVRVRDIPGQARPFVSSCKPSSASLELCSYLLRGGHGRVRQSGSKTIDDLLRPGSSAPLPAPWE